jgi:hypothetical protein
MKVILKTIARYKIPEKLGEGGMGAVLAILGVSALDLPLGRQRGKPLFSVDRD